MKLKSKLVASGLITAVTCALVGSITGTFAWYGYSTRATATIAGTSIGKAANLQIGIVDNALDSIKGLEKENGSNIFWQPVSGGLRGDAIADFFNKKSYAGKDGTELRPITSGDMFDGTKRKDIAPEAFTLYQGPEHEAAESTDYFILPLALRIYNVQEKADVEKDEYLPKTKIYLSDLEVDIDDQIEADYPDAADLVNAFRIDFKEEREDLQEAVYTTVAPGRDDDGKTELAGLLDLNRDGFADVIENDYDYKARNERVYGSIKEGTEVTRADTLTQDYSVIPQNYDYPVHLVVDSHLSEKNVHVVTGLTPCEQEFKGKDSVVAQFDSSMRLVDGEESKAIATTPDTDDAIVYLTLVAWIEGWDMEGVTADTLGVPFHLNLTFQIDRVD